MGEETPKRHVYPEKLRELGFSEKEIAAAQDMEAEGLFDMEPSDDLVERALQKCIPLLPKPKGPAPG